MPYYTNQILYTDKIIQYFDENNMKRTYEGVKELLGIRKKKDYPQASLLLKRPQMTLMNSSVDT